MLRNTVTFLYFVLVGIQAASPAALADGGGTTPRTRRPAATRRTTFNVSRVAPGKSPGTYWIAFDGSAPPVGTRFVLAENGTPLATLQALTAPTRNGSRNWFQASLIRGQSSASLVGSTPRTGEYEGGGVATASTPRLRHRIGVDLGLGAAEPAGGLLDLIVSYNVLSSVRIGASFGYYSDDTGTTQSFGVAAKYLPLDGELSPFVGAGLSYVNISAASAAYLSSTAIAITLPFGVDYQGASGLHAAAGGAFAYSGGSFGWSGILLQAGWFF